jgi:hypothetical protein
MASCSHLLLLFQGQHDHLYRSNCVPEFSGDAPVYIGTPKALEIALTKARGAAGQELIRGEKEFTILDGGYAQFDYVVLDEVHALNGPEGDALQ